MAEELIKYFGSLIIAAGAIITGLKIYVNGGKKKKEEGKPLEICQERIETHKEKLDEHSISIKKLQDDPLEICEQRFKNDKEMLRKHDCDIEKLEKKVEGVEGENKLILEKIQNNYLLIRKDIKHMKQLIIRGIPLNEDTDTTRHLKDFTIEVER